MDADIIEETCKEILEKLPGRAYTFHFGNYLFDEGLPEQREGITSKFCDGKEAGSIIRTTSAYNPRVRLPLRRQHLFDGHVCLAKDGKRQEFDELVEGLKNKTVWGGTNLLRVYVHAATRIIWREQMEKLMEGKEEIMPSEIFKKAISEQKHITLQEFRKIIEKKYPADEWKIRTVRLDECEYELVPNQKKGFVYVHQYEPHMLVARKLEPRQ